MRGEEVCGDGGNNRWLRQARGRVDRLEVKSWRHEWKDIKCAKAGDGTHTRATSGCCSHWKKGRKAAGLEGRRSSLLKSRWRRWQRCLLRRELEGWGSLAKREQPLSNTKWMQTEQMWEESGHWIEGGRVGKACLMIVGRSAR